MARRHINEAGLNLIMTFEGFSPRPYLCPAGVWTIGYGHTRGVTKESPHIDELEAMELLRGDVASAEASVSRLVKVPLTDGQFAALVSFVFNLGAGRLQASTLLRRVNAGDHAAAAEEFKKWTLAGGKRSKGLIRRRAAEIALYSAAMPTLGQDTARPDKEPAAEALSHSPRQPGALGNLRPYPPPEQVTLLSRLLQIFQ